MSQVVSIAPEEVLEHSDSNLYLIILTSPTQTSAWYAGSFHTAGEDGFSNLGIFKKQRVSEEYRQALAVAKNETSERFAGNLSIVPLPVFNGGKI